MSQFVPVRLAICDRVGPTLLAGRCRSDVTAHIIGAEAVAKAEPGYTPMVAKAGTFTIKPLIYPKGKLPYDPNTAFVPISGPVRINQAPLADRVLPVATAAQV